MEQIGKDTSNDCVDYGDYIFIFDEEYREEDIDDSCVLESYYL